jgi:hypothetical protein
MLNHSDCGFRIALVNTIEWLRPARTSATRTSMRVRLGSALVGVVDGPNPAGCAPA